MKVSRWLLVSAMAAFLAVACDSGGGGGAEDVSVTEDGAVLPDQTTGEDVPVVTDTPINPECKSDADCVTILGEIGACKRASCDTTGGEAKCIAVDKAAGTVCDDADACTLNDVCTAGVCAGTADPACAQACTSDTDCAAFEDGNACNGTLKCTDNVCGVDAATVVTCDPANDTDCSENTCDPTSGACAMADANEGGACAGDPAATCGGTWACAAGECVCSCTPQCEGRVCGDDGCGGTCGTCSPDETCDETTGTCAACEPVCGDQECGLDPVCGTPCGECVGAEVCTVDGQCIECTPNCEGLECGPDPECNVECGPCGGTDECAEGVCVAGSACGDISEVGCCADSMVVWCEEGAVQYLDCGTLPNPDAQTCGYSEEQGFFTCGATDTLPAGLALECPSVTCEPGCDALGVECGMHPACPGVFCGECPNGETCSDGQCVEDPCNGITFFGCCAGNQAVYCAEGALQYADCGEDGCGWTGDAEGYYCGATGASPYPDFPMECCSPEQTCEDLGRECGAHPECGDLLSCGTCPAGEECSEAGTCEGCDPVAACEGRECGIGDCGIECGTCEFGQACDETGMCVEDLCYGFSSCCDGDTAYMCTEQGLSIIDCTVGNETCGYLADYGVYYCFGDPADKGECPTCDNNALCSANGWACGAGCPGETCGTCTDGQFCTADHQCEVCTCEGKTCGEDGCGNSCGTCGEGNVCQGTTCVETETLGCDAIVEGDTGNGTAGRSVYEGCVLFGDEGPEVGYDFVAPADGNLIIKLQIEDPDADLDIFLVDASGNCMMFGDNGIGTLEAPHAVTAGQRYGIIIDTYAGEAGIVTSAFTLAIDCIGVCEDSGCTGRECGPAPSLVCTGETCGECAAEGEYCTPEGQCEADPCAGGYTDMGCCDDGVYYACFEENGVRSLYIEDCGEAPCGWLAYWPGLIEFLACGGTDPMPEGVDPTCPACDINAFCSARGWQCGLGCGGLECGTCDATSFCNADHQCEACTCEGKQCGDDGCGNSCGECGEGEVCSNDLCIAPCGASVPLACGDTLDGDTTDGGLALSTYSCEGAFTEAGPERVYTFTTDTDSSVTLNLSAAADLDLIVLLGCAPDACVDGSFGGSSETITFDAVADTTYYVVVESYGDPATFTLGATCDVVVPCVPECGAGFTCVEGQCLALCGSPLADLTCESPMFASNNGADSSASIVDTYSCETYTESGPEDVYTFTAPADGTYTFTLNILGEVPADLDLFILGDACDPTSCLVYDNVSATLEATAGTTYNIVVDGYMGAVADYEITLGCPAP